MFSSIRATIGSAEKYSSSASHAKHCPQVTSSMLICFCSRHYLSELLYLFRPFSLSPALSSLHQAVPGSSLQFTSLPAQITELGQAVHYFKFTACPFGLPQGGIKSGFGWRSDLVPSPNPSFYSFTV